MERLSGTGLGFRFPHAQAVLALGAGTAWVPPWFEVIADDLLLPGARHQVVEKLRERWSLALHAVGLNIAGCEPLDRDYVRRLGELARRYAVALVSDHLCWSAHGNRQHFDLLPFPFNEQTLAHVGGRVERVQEMLGRSLVLENPSSYVRFAADTMDEWTFVSELCRRTGCRLLLDLNNLYTNAVNFDRCPNAELERLLAAVDAASIAQVHVAGSEPVDGGVDSPLIDTHGAPVSAPVRRLLERLDEHVFGLPVCLERDNALPPLDRLLAEARAIDSARRRVRRGATPVAVAAAASVA